MLKKTLILILMSAAFLKSGAQQPDSFDLDFFLRAVTGNSPVARRPEIASESTT